MKFGFPTPTRILPTAFALFVIAQATQLSAAVPFTGLQVPSIGTGVQVDADTITNETKQTFSDEDPFQEKTIQLSYDGTPWKMVIEDFTNKTGLALQPISSYPEGALTLFEVNEYTVMEGLRQAEL